jgi:Flp pilus assembly CpaF family ATPase
VSIERERELRNKVYAVQSRLQLKVAAAGTAPDGRERDKYELISEFFWPSWKEVAEKSLPASLEYIGLRFFKKQIKDILFGYGPLQDLLRSPGVSEIMVIDSNNIYVERSNRIQNSGRKFVSDDSTLHVIQRIVQKAEREINYANPLVDARLDDGSRVHAAVAPVAVRGPCLTIRKFPKHNFTIEQLVGKRTITTPVKNFLAACVGNKCNILISGGTGSGKTTLLNCLTSFFGDEERIVTIEDTAELQVQKKHVVTLETKGASRSGKGAITIAELVRNSLRMRPSRIIVGETRGAEALDMLQALNTGHSGSLTTIHSNSTRDAVSRLEVLVSQASASLPLASIRQQIVSAIDLIVQLNRLEDRRAVTEIAEVVELDDQTGEIRLRTLFQTYRDTKETEITETGTEPFETGCTYSLLPTGRLPTFVGELIAKGLLDVKGFL